MANYTGDQQTTTAIVVNGAHVNASLAAVKAAAPASSTYQFTAAFAIHFNGTNLAFLKGKTYVLDATEKAALLAASAPMTAV
jgi:hypothetical protein